MARPAILVWLDDRPVCRVDAVEPIAPRAWQLGVLAVQLRVEAGGVRGRLRGHVTGGPEPTVVELPAVCRVHACLVEPGGATPARAPLPPPELAGDLAAVRVHRDGAPLAEARLAAARAAEEPAPRGFGHVFCRWLRAGGIEAGFDLTDFWSLPPGRKYERMISEELRAGEMVSFAIAYAT